MQTLKSTSIHIFVQVLQTSSRLSQKKKLSMSHLSLKGSFVFQNDCFALTSLEQA